jgi:hypothetical protein
MKRGLEAGLVDAVRILRCETATNRFVLAVRRLHDALLESRYNPNWASQPRVPGGEAAGGEWPAAALGTPHPL